MQDQEPCATLHTTSSSLRWRLGLGLGLGLGLDDDQPGALRSLKSHEMASNRL